ncbi:TetR/AcrR family transcriptional regulator [Nocardioides sp. CPCC 206347]|uniref:TetR/AcrR family transcriptional regulator n=2 Tax=Nocardioides TaxID=1839 RepID=UPI003B4375FC
MSTAPRAYDSTGRRAAAARTRRQVVEVATRLFAERGWAGTSVRDVAREAGVAVETVYSAVGSKVALLRAAIEVAVVGDDAEVPLADRAVFRAVAEGDLDARLRAGSELLVGIHGRGARVIRALRGGAMSEPELAVLSAEFRAQQIESFAQALGLVARRTVTQREAETLLGLVGEESYLVLTDEFGWSTAEVVDLVATTVVNVLNLVEEESDG